MVSRAATTDEIMFWCALQRDEMVDESDEAHRCEKIFTTILPAKKTLTSMTLCGIVRTDRDIHASSWVAELVSDGRQWRKSEKTYWLSCSTAVKTKHKHFWSHCL